LRNAHAHKKEPAPEGGGASKAAGSMKGELPSGSIKWRGGAEKSSGTTQMSGEGQRFEGKTGAQKIEAIRTPSRGSKRKKVRGVAKINRIGGTDSNPT